MQYYSQLTSEQRYQIYALLKKNHTQTDLAGIVGVHKSTISREIRRNSGGRGYRPTQAHCRALQRLPSGRSSKLAKAIKRPLEHI